MTEAERIIVPIQSIVTLQGRGRKEFKQIQKLAQSIQENGLMNPIFVTNHEIEGKYTLVAGELRLRASTLAGLTHVPISFAKDLSPIQQKILELEENVGREDLTWEEEAELHRQINELKQKENPTWTQKDTAALVSVSEGHMSRQITIAQRLKDNPELKKKIERLDIVSAYKVIENEDKIAKVTRLKDQGKLIITSDLKLGSCIDLIKELKTASVDLLVTDPPYGIAALEDLREGSGQVMPGHTLMSEHHNQNLEKVLALLSALAPELARVLKPGAHFYVFSAFQYVGDFIKALAPLEFQPPMLIWDRNRTTSPGYGYNYLNRTEAIIYGCNPPRGKRLAKHMFNILSHNTVSDKERVYPTEKPQALLRDLISQSSILNDLVLDPFAGSASTLKAARSLGRKSIGFEIDENSWKKAQFHLAETEKTLAQEVSA